MMHTPFGQQIAHVIEVVKSLRRTIPAGQEENDTPDRAQLAQQWSRIIMQVVVSLFVLVGAFILVFKYPSDPVRDPAFGIIGVVVGYWLR